MSPEYPRTITDDGYIALAPNGPTFCREGLVPFTHCDASDGHTHMVLLATREELLALLAAERRQSVRDRARIRILARKGFDQRGSVGDRAGDSRPQRGGVERHLAGRFALRDLDPAHLRAAAQRQRTGGGEVSDLQRLVSVAQDLAEHDAHIRRLRSQVDWSRCTNQVDDDEGRPLTCARQFGSDMDDLLATKAGCDACELNRNLRAQERDARRKRYLAMRRVIRLAAHVAPASGAEGAGGHANA
jgi:hypothetical protein